MINEGKDLLSTHLIYAGMLCVRHISTLLIKNMRLMLNEMIQKNAPKIFHIFGFFFHLVLVLDISLIECPDLYQMSKVLIRGNIVGSSMKWGKRYMGFHIQKICVHKCFVE